MKKLRLEYSWVDYKIIEQDLTHWSSIGNSSIYWTFCGQLVGVNRWFHDNFKRFINFD